jgi:alkylation response protein AidB-like acyl-CoA dehydrogenase
MDFGFSEQQVMLRTTARDFLTREYPKTKIRTVFQEEKGYDPKVWRDMAELGWQGLVLPAEYEGTEAGFLDLVILLEEMGRNIVPGPFFSTVAHCSLALLEFGTKEQKSRFLPPIARGEEIWALALIEESASYNPAEINMPAVAKGDGYTLSGSKIFVADAHVANYMLVAARIGKSSATGGITLFIVDTKDPGIKIELMPTMAGDRQFRVTFDKVSVPKSHVLGSVDKGWGIVDFILQRAAVLKCAEISGACQAVLDMTSAYAKDRVQFDRPIGSFQAVQMKLADMVIDIDAIQYLLYLAAWEISIGKPSQMHISAAKAKAAEAFQTMCIEGMTAHGAIGFTEDCDLGFYYRRVREAEFTGGNTGLHLEKIAAGLDL